MTRQQKTRISFKNVAHKLPEIEGMKLSEATAYLGFRESEACRHALYDWRRKEWIDFTLNRGIYTQVRLLTKTKTIELQEYKELEAKGIRAKAKYYYAQVLSTSNIIEGVGSKIADRNEATKLQQRALAQIPHDVFLELEINANQIAEED